MEQSMIVEEGIVKRVIYAGRGDLPLFHLGAKLSFHYVTKLQDEEGTVLDDSKKSHRPMEIIVGKKFKLEVWEKCLKSMRVSEVAEFRASRAHCGAYPAVAKTLRDFHEGDGDGEHRHQHRTACCAGTMLQSTEGLGYTDLNLLMKEPKPLTFIIELLSVSQPDEYEKEMWQMDEAEQEAAVPVLRERGNAFFKENKLEEASKKYGEALSILENCSLREKPHTTEWEKFETAKIPLLLNFSQCHLGLGNYRLVVEHTTTVIDKDCKNVKAYYRRGKALGFIWEMERAREDLLRVKELDPTLSALVEKELSFFDKRWKDKEIEEKKKLVGKIL